MTASRKGTVSYMGTETVMPLALNAVKHPELRSLVTSLFTDVSRIMSTYCHILDDDLTYLLSRLDNEGERFLYTTLPDRKSVV